MTTDKDMQIHTAPLPEHIKAMTLEQVMDPGRHGAMTRDDLYWMLYRAATETASEKTHGALVKAFKPLLDDKLGADNFGYNLLTARDLWSGTSTLDARHLPSNWQWAGADVGVFPGIGQMYGIICLVWWI